MKKHLVFILLLGFIFQAEFIQVKSQTLLTIYNLDGSEKKINSGSLNKITFTDTDLICHYFNGVTEPFSILSLQKIGFNNTATIKNDEYPQVKISLFPNPSSEYIELKNIPDKTPDIAIYNISGVMVGNYQKPYNSALINIGYLPKGVYFVKANNLILKFIKL